MPERGDCCFVMRSTGRLRSNGGASRPHGARCVDGHLPRRDNSARRAGGDQTDLALRRPAAVQEGLRRHPRQGTVQDQEQRYSLFLSISTMIVRSCVTRSSSYWREQFLVMPPLIAYPNADSKHRRHTLRLYYYLKYFSSFLYAVVLCLLLIGLRGLLVQVADSSTTKQFLFKRSLQVAHRRRKLVEEGKLVGPALELQYRLLDKVGNPDRLTFACLCTTNELELVWKLQ